MQVLQNLISNGLKYRSPGCDAAHRNQFRTAGDRWVIHVRDDGIGIDPAYHRQVFGVFKRLHGSDIPGTGIGLAICQRVVERAGGEIWVESQPGDGANLRLYSAGARCQLIAPDHGVIGADRGT